MTPLLWFDYIVMTAGGLAFAGIISIPVWLMWRAAIGWAVGGVIADVPGWEAGDVEADKV